MATPDRPELRVSDQDRERAVQEIREHFALGRLTEGELSERVQAAYSARTMDELQKLKTDLPPLPASTAELRAELVQRRAHLTRRLIQQSGCCLVPFVICTVIWVSSGAHGQFWPIWVVLAALIPLLRNGWRLYGPAPELDRVEQELEWREAQRDRANRRAPAPSPPGSSEPGRERQPRSRR